jgi:RNA recognition motif-containing protein
MPSLRLDEESDCGSAVYIEDLELDAPPQAPVLTPDHQVISLEHALPQSSDLECGSTIMLRNIPNRLSQAEIAECIRFRGLFPFDFLYAPLDFKSKMNLGYCFVNFGSPEVARSFWTHIDGHRLIPSETVSHSAKLCGVSWARIQGLDANIRHYRNNPVNELPFEFRPCLFDIHSGLQLQFPASDLPAGSSPNLAVKASRLEKKRVVTQKNKLFVGGLNLTTQGKALERHFSQFGPVQEAVVMTDKHKGGASKGFGFCTFSTEAAVNAALAAPVHWIDGVSVAVRHYTSSVSQ